jgi:hypothetical protein
MSLASCLVSFAITIGKLPTSILSISRLSRCAEELCTSLRQTCLIFPVSIPLWDSKLVKIHA